MEESTCLGERGIPATGEESAREQVDQTQAGKTEELEPVEQYHETPQEVHDDVYDNREDEERGMNQPGGSCAIETKGGIKTPAIPKVIFQSGAQDRMDVAQAVKRGRGRPRKDCSLGAKREDNEEPLDPDKGSVPDRKMGNCLDTKLPEPVCRREKGPSPPSPCKKSQLRPSRDGETMRRDKKEPIPGHDEGGSAANRVRRFVTSCPLSLWRVARGSKHMFLELIHGLFIT